ncbi:Rop family plasmid primer RNA-binding protein, partial [Klebsiella pneumoniae]|uniref:Rop family plasmid primer RNA-binding protein n=1 Tax=Klebsiella pneumoniae TaxID=573 RepID=UPI001F15FC6A
NQSLLLLEKLNELDLCVEAVLCEKLHADAERLFRTLSSRLDALQAGNSWPECLFVRMPD